MESTNDGINYLDSAGVLIALGAEVEGGGKVAGFSAPDMNHGGVYVRWSESEEPEFFAATGHWSGEVTVDDLTIDRPRKVT